MMGRKKPDQYKKTIPNLKLSQKTNGFVVQIPEGSVSITQYDAISTHLFHRRAFFLSDIRTGFLFTKPLWRRVVSMKFCQRHF
jgi:hypothetical protein